VDLPRRQGVPAVSRERARRLPPARLVVARAVPLLGEERHPDHTDVAGAAGLGGVRVGNPAEAKRGDRVIALAEAIDRERGVRLEKVAAIGEGPRAAIDDVEPVYGGDRFEAAAGSVGEDNRVPLSCPPDDIRVIARLHTLERATVLAADGQRD
jgi:hypothetical protein